MATLSTTNHEKWSATPDTGATRASPKYSLWVCDTKSQLTNTNPGSFLFLPVQKSEPLIVFLCEPPIPIASFLLLPPHLKGLLFLTKYLEEIRDFRFMLQPEETGARTRVLARQTLLTREYKLPWILILPREIFSEWGWYVKRMEDVMYRHGPVPAPHRKAAHNWSNSVS